MKAGIDFGSSLTKAVWMHDGEYQFASTADMTLEDIAKNLRNHGVQRIHIAGVGYSGHPALDDFNIVQKEGDPIKNETDLQSIGAKHIMQMSGMDSDRFLLVSMGTGSSYTSVDGDSYSHHPIGSIISGGFILGLGSILGADDFKTINICAKKGTPLHILYKDMMPDLAGQDLGEYIIAAFGKVTKDSDMDDVFATLLSSVAGVTVAKIVDLNIHPTFDVPQDIVYIGSTVSRSSALQDMLMDYTPMIGKTPHIPKNAEYPLAMGAYHVDP